MTFIDPCCAEAVVAQELHIIDGKKVQFVILQLLYALCVCRLIQNVPTLKLLHRYKRTKCFLEVFHH